ncbi:methyltransferase domain-containing protein [Marinimicrobium sp. ARAG 43.8]|uniref:methyltransferase domain-containing protein n=1 Tax=Marinimicrobium sp. ARAG 43.8 TaxID=3418719 RepID=UPI003CEDC9AF
MITAAQCADDIERSRVFMQGIYNAIGQKLDTGEEVRVLYAGTGPLGMLVIPLLPLFDAKRVQVTLLDIHQESLDKLQRIIQHLNIEAHITAQECTDATTWRPPDGRQFDIIVSETMKHLLQQEPQVQIFTHLEQFLAPGGTLIPREVRLSASLVDSSDPLRKIPSERPLGTFFLLNQKTARQLRAGEAAALTCELPVPLHDGGHPHLKLATQIQVYGEHRLGNNQSQLTLPRFKYNVNLSPGSKLRCHYQQGQSPDWQFTVDSEAVSYQNTLPQTFPSHPHP